MDLGFLLPQTCQPHWMSQLMETMSNLGCNLDAALYQDKFKASNANVKQKKKLVLEFSLKYTTLIILEHFWCLPSMNIQTIGYISLSKLILVEMVKKNTQTIEQVDSGPKW